MQRQWSLKATALLGMALMCLVLLAGGAGDAHAWSGGDDNNDGNCENPLAVRAVTSQANILIIFDSSGSMNEAMFSPDYRADSTYSGNFGSTSSYSVSSSGSKTPKSFNNSWPSTPAAILVASDHGESGRYLGNYLNWVYFHATALQRANIPQVTRVQVGKQAINALLANAGNRRYGIMIFNGEDGGKLIAGLGSSVSTLQQEVDDIKADAWTPSAETFVDAMDYFKSTGSSAPITDQCQKSFILFVSDGHPTKDRDIPSYLKDYDKDGKDPGTCASIGAPFFPESYDCSGYVDDVTKYLYDTDLRSNLSGKQNVRTFVIGFNINAPVLVNAAVQGGGQYFSANNITELTASLDSTLATIDSYVASGSAISVRTSDASGATRIYRARYESLTWLGYLEAFELPYTDGEDPVWDAGALLEARSPSTRVIHTTTNGTSLLAFTTANASTLKTPLTASSNTDASNIIKYIRGESVSNTRDRQGWKLGDIVESAPVLAGAPSAYHTYLSYPTFQANNATRKEVIYVGANDGMLHCFNAATGAEDWAYIPRNQLARLKALMDEEYCHNFYVNMTPALYDIYSSSAKAWKTVLIGGQERGGSGYFALDVTNPDAMKFMWDVNLPTLRGSWNAPRLVRDKTANQHRLVAGTGYDDSLGMARLLTLDPTNGNLLSTITLGTGVKPNLVTASTAIDMNFDGYDDRLYCADLGGRVWRINLTANPWTVTQIFSGTQPIQGAPVLTLDKQGRVMIFFGTGRYLVEADRTTFSTMTLYGLIDDGGTTLLTQSSLVDQTSTINAIPSNKRGWFINLTRTGERCIRTPALVEGVVYFPTFVPATGACEIGGTSWMSKVDYQDGSAPDNKNGSENNVVAGREQSMGQGIMSSPAFDMATQQLILQSSNASLVFQDADANVQRVRVRSWRQNWTRGVTP